MNIEIKRNMAEMTQARRIQSNLILIFFMVPSLE